MIFLKILRHSRGGGNLFKSLKLLYGSPIRSGMTGVAFLTFLLYIFLFFTPTSVHAIYDPLSVSNNKFGIHIISATVDEASPAADLVNSSGGDWGYITVLMEEKDRDHGKWQQFFNDLRNRHLIPIVRLATGPQDTFWKRPYDNEEQAWADFLDDLIWPTKNRYVIVYNEPNHATEWGNTVDAFDYAHTLDKTIDALKNKNSDFFVLNAGLDASSPQKLPAYEDEAQFLVEMNAAVPGIFNKLDGWVSHSYPNPDFISSPDKTGRGSVRTFEWEMDQLKTLGLSKTLPIFITETGWKHAEGTTYDRSLPTASTVANYYKTAFSGAWNDPRIVAVTPFLLDYQDNPFDHFSFKRPTGQKQTRKLLANANVLGVQNSVFYPQYDTISSLPKVVGSPVQEYRGKLVEGELPHSLVQGESYTFQVTFKNIGQSTWSANDQVKLLPLTVDNSAITIEDVTTKNETVEPGSDKTFFIRVKGKKLGAFKTQLQLLHDGQQFSSDPIDFSGVIKSPVLITVKTKLAWGKETGGDYVLSFKHALSSIFQKVVLGKDGTVADQEAYTVLPDIDYQVTLYRPHYKEKTITQTLHSGENILDFGELQPDYPSAVIDPEAFWKLLPISP